MSDVAFGVAGAAARGVEREQAAREAAEERARVHASIIEADRYERALEARFVGQEAAAHVSSLFDAGSQSAIEDAYEPADDGAADALLHADEEEDAAREAGDGEASSDDDEDVWEAEDAWEGEYGC